MTDYLTVNELKASLALTGETFPDADLQAAITAASRAIDNACNRRFWPDATSGETRDYTPWHDWRLEIDDLVELTSVQVDRDEDGTFEETWVLVDDFRLEPANASQDGWPWTLLVARASTGGWPVGATQSVRVTGRFGWSAAPDAISEAAGIVAARLMRRTREAPFGIVSVGLDGGGVRIGRLDPDVAMLIDPYRRLTV